MSQPSTGSTSRSLTPKPYNRAHEDSNKSHERLHSDLSQYANHSPTVSNHKGHSHSNSLFGSSSKMPGKSREQALHTDRLRNRSSQQVQYYNPKNMHNVTTDLSRGKSNRSHYAATVTKTEPNIDAEINYPAQINKLLEKINKLKHELGQSQEREGQYLNKLSNLEKENKSLQMVIEEKDKRLHDLSHKSKEDKLRMYQFLTELETHKQNNAEQQYRDDVSTVRLSELCDSGRKFDKVTLEKGVQTTEGGNQTMECAKCENINNYCEYLVGKLGEVEQASKYLIKENNAMKDTLMKARRAETDYVRARSEIERRALEIQNDFDKQAQVYGEIIAENITIRRALKDATDYHSNQGTTEAKKGIQLKLKPESSSKQNFNPIPSSLKALVGAEKLLKAVN